MKSSDELTPLGRVRRMRYPARAELKAYGLDFDDLVLARHAGDTLG